MSSKAATTRLSILNKAFELIYRNGYRTTSVDDIIATTQVTKGAFFYHFKNKDEMGIAMINEVLYPAMTKYVGTEASEDPKEDVYQKMKHMLLEDTFFDIRYGCPAINLVEELASYNHSFHSALHRLTTHQKNLIEVFLENGKKIGSIKPESNTADAATFILSGYGGARNMGKVFGDQAYTSYLSQLRIYLNHL